MLIVQSFPNVIFFDAGAKLIFHRSRHFGGGFRLIFGHYKTGDGYREKDKKGCLEEYLPPHRAA
jgi:hypothetical protein